MNRERNDYKERNFLYILALLLVGAVIVIIQTALAPVPVAESDAAIPISAPAKTAEASAASALEPLPVDEELLSMPTAEDILDVDPLTGIRRYLSPRDKDGDGIDDQTDILLGAKRYVATNPKYESRYYDDGYPNDGYGVCTDVVAFALREAGYDLKQLIYDDILAEPEIYDCMNPDINLEFRRVSCIDHYLSRHATTLPIELDDPTQWQGGDILVMDGHIGILSDRRNSQGYPYLIHHGAQDQDSYEQDVLLKRTDLVAHYRMS